MDYDKELHYAQNHGYRDYFFEEDARNLISQRVCADIYRVRKENNVEHFLYKVFIEYADIISDKEFKGLQRNGLDYICKSFDIVFCYCRGEVCQLIHRGEDEWILKINERFCEYFTIDIMSRLQDFISESINGYDDFINQLSHAYIKNKFCKEYVEMIGLTVDYFFKIGLYANFIYKLQDIVVDCKNMVANKRKK